MTKSTPDEPETAEAAEAQALATRKPPVGLAAAMEGFQAVDENAAVLWKTKGPKGSRIVELASVLVETGGKTERFIVQVFASGAFDVYAKRPPAE